MNKAELYILKSLQQWVWSGFYSIREVNRMVDDILEKEADAVKLDAAVTLEFEKKAEAEMSWPIETDCDRLNQVFARLNELGVIALQNAGYTMSDGFTELAEAEYEREQSSHPPGHWQGFCFYHGQDLERAVNGEGLRLAFGSMTGDEAKNIQIGNLIKSIVQEHGFSVEWNGLSTARLNLFPLNWQRRLAR